MHSDPHSSGQRRCPIISGMTSQTPLPPPPPRNRSRRRVWLAVGIGLIGARVAFALLDPLGGRSSAGRCDLSDGGAVVNASGAVKLREAGFNIEDDNCFWDYRTMMYLDFDGPVGLSVSGTASPGEASAVEISIYNEFVVLSTEIPANRSACVMTVVTSTPERLAGSFECNELVAAHYGPGSNLVPDPDLPLSTLVGTFAIVRSS